MPLIARDITPTKRSQMMVCHVVAVVVAGTGLSSSAWATPIDLSHSGTPAAFQEPDSPDPPPVKDAQPSTEKPVLSEQSPPPPQEPETPPEEPETPPEEVEVPPDESEVPPDESDPVEGESSAEPADGSAPEDPGKSKDDHSREPRRNSILLDVAKLAWPAIGLEYERRLLRKVGVAAYGEIGQYNPVAARTIQGNPLAEGDLRFRGGGLRLNLYAIGGFQNGLTTGVTVQARDYAYQSRASGSSRQVVATTLSTVAGPHIGYKLVARPGLSIALAGGVGYHRTGPVRLEAAGATSTEPNPLAQIPVMTFSSARLGWSF